MFELKIVVLQKAELYAKDEVVAIAPKLKRVIQNSSGKKLWGKNHPKKHNNWKGKKWKRDEHPNKKDFPLYETCGKHHGRKNYKKIGACFKCRKSSHFIQNCQEMKGNQRVPKKDQ